MSQINVIRILIADDQRLMLDGLRTLLELETDMEVVGEVEDGQAAVDAYGRLQPEVVLIDIRMPGMDGVEATRRICERWPNARVIMLTTFDDDAYVYEGIRGRPATTGRRGISRTSLRARASDIAPDGLRDDNREIVRRLSLAHGTVKNYVTTILQKLGARDRTQAALRARELGLLEG